MAERNHYEVLGLAKSAGPEDVRRAYLERLHEVHPDLNAVDAEAAHERTIEAVSAYRVLSDPETRRRYDFRCSFPPRTDGELPGLRLLKGRRAAEAEERFAEALALLRAEDLVAAVEPLKTALRLEPAFSAASYNLALVAALLGNGAFALDVLTEAVRRDPKDASLPRLRKSVVAAFLTV